MGENAVNLSGFLLLFFRWLLLLGFLLFLLLALGHVRYLHISLIVNIFKYKGFSLSEQGSWRKRLNDSGKREEKTLTLRSAVEAYFGCAGLIRQKAQPRKGGSNIETRHLPL